MHVPRCGESDGLGQRVVTVVMICAVTGFVVVGAGSSRPDEEHPPMVASPKATTASAPETRWSRIGVATELGQF